MKFGKKKRYALLLAAKDSHYVKKVHGGYYNVFVKAFGDEGDQWDMFRVAEGVLPAIEQLEEYDGFVISGSPCDAFGHDPWILNLCSLLQTLHSMHKKILGICFGHQVLCRALGGKVGRANGGWDIGLRKVMIADIETLHSLQLFCGSTDRSLPSCLTIMECHQDEVCEVPPGGKVIASSEKTGVEMFCYGDNILGIQGHPEYSKGIMRNLIQRLLDNKAIEKEIADHARATIEAAEADRMLWQEVCQKFLKGVSKNSSVS